MSKNHSFHENLAQNDEELLEAICAFEAKFGDIVERFSTRKNDRGIDAIWTTSDGDNFFIDFKVQRTPNQRYRDIPLEYEVLFDGQTESKAGWACGKGKATEIYAFYWKHSGELLKYSAPKLWQAAMDNRQVWLKRYGRTVRNKDNVATMAYVPREVLEAAMSAHALVYGLRG
jgi:hypothetical protein